MQKIILDVIPNGVCPRVYVNQYDIGREFQISFKEGWGSYYFQNNLTFTINGRKSDNHIFEYTEADKWDSTHYVITKSGSGASTKVTIGTTEQMTAAPGETDVQLIFTDSTNAVIGTLSFIMVVQECPGIVGDPSESVVPDVVRFVNNVRPNATGNVYLPLSEIDGIDDNVAYTEKTREMGTQHVAGEFVFVDSDNQLYEITSTINSGGTLTPGTNATARSVGDVLSQLNSDLVKYVDITFDDPSLTQYPNASVYYFSKPNVAELTDHAVLSAFVVTATGVKQMPWFTCNSNGVAGQKTIYGWVQNNSTVATKLIVRVAYI